MSSFSFSNVKISGISVVVPTRSLCLLDDTTIYDGDQKKIKRVINSSGFLNRRVNEEHVMTSDLCYAAAVDLLRNTNTDNSEIDAVLFVSYTPDYLMPATAYVLHKRLGLKHDCIVMDIPQACSGYVIGLFQSCMLANAGCKKVLLLVGDSFSKFSDMFRDGTAPVFGDAGSATLIEYTETADKMYFTINSNSDGYDSLMCVNGGFRNIPRSTDFYEDGKFKYQASFDGGRIFDFTMKEIAPSIKQILEDANLSVENIDWFAMHQANKFILENIAMQVGINMDRVPTATLSKYGNQCGASIPGVIANELKDVVENNKSRVLLSGFGVGLSWANAIVNIDKIYCSGIIEYEEDMK